GRRRLHHTSHDDAICSLGVTLSQQLGILAEISNWSPAQMEGPEWESAFVESSDDELYLEEDDDNEELFDLCGPLKKLQFRSEASKARWDEELGMAEVTEKKGKMWITMGIMRSGKTYCSIEETLFLAEIGALHLMDSNNNVQSSLKDIYEMLADEKNGCCWELFEAYKHLKSLGYIVGRHGIPWTMKGVKKAESNSCSSQADFHSNNIDDGEDSVGITKKMDNLQISDGLKPVFDVYLPNSKFRKTSPGDPNFLLCLVRGSMPPSRAKMEALENECGGIPVKVCHVDHGRVSFFSFEKIELPLLP
ncbi:tRNA-splicing endonuclease subunit Sen54, partial [Linum grandiflorum]